MSSEEKIEELAASFARITKAVALDKARLLESPMEMLFLMGLYASMRFWPMSIFPADVYWPYPKPTGVVVACFEVSGCGGMVVSQPEIPNGARKYRVDFAVLLGRTRLVVEVDGHDFHERTKAQAAADKQRDRSLTAKGWKVVRFTGSEVYANAVGCADQLWELLIAETERDGEELAQ